MLGVNKVILIGNLGKDPELRYTPGGQPTTSFSLATTERWTDKNGQRQERTEWHNVVAWGKLAELVSQYLKKGRAAYVEGRITTRSWDDRDGNKKYRTEIVANQVQFIGTGGASGANDAYTPQGTAGRSGPEATEPPPPASEQGPVVSEQGPVVSEQEPVVEEDLPF